MSRTATITAGVLLFVSAMAGTRILAIFRIDIFSFMIDSGILLFIVSIQLLTHRAWRLYGDRVAGSATVKSGVVPLAFSFLAGSVLLPML